MPRLHENAEYSVWKRFSIAKFCTGLGFYVPDLWHGCFPMLYNALQMSLLFCP